MEKVTGTLLGTNTLKKIKYYKNLSWIVICFTNNNDTTSNSAYYKLFFFNY